MKLLFDNNLSVLLPKAVEYLFPGSAHVAALGLSESSDLVIWEYARTHHFTIVSKDKDFYHLVIAHGSPPKVVRITVGNCNNASMISLIIKHSNDLSEFINGEKHILMLQ